MRRMMAVVLFGVLVVAVAVTLLSVRQQAPSPSIGRNATAIPRLMRLAAPTPSSRLRNVRPFDDWSAFAGQGASPLIAVDQLGYRPGDAKVAKVASQAGEFSLVDSATRQIALQGIASIRAHHDAASGATVSDVSFSRLTAPGRYYIELPGVGRSFGFDLRADVYDQALVATLRGFYLQRCGGVVDDGVWGHVASHLDDGYLWNQPRAKIDVTGGWHDAGDYGKYVPSGAKAVADLLAAFELYADRFDRGSGLPGILEEARWELDWLRKMQRPDGAVYHKVTATGWTGDVMPDEDRAPRYVFDVSTAATADFAAVLAAAARVYQPFDSAFARDARSAAERAWSYLALHPTIEPPDGFRNPPGVSTGSYGDGDDSDERFWAAAELFRLTGQSMYDAYVLQRLRDWQRFFTSPTATTERRADGALAYLFSKGDAEARRGLVGELERGAAGILKIAAQEGYGVALAPDEYYWGSNGVALNRATLLLYAERFTGNAEYTAAALDQLHYIFGRNVLGKAFVTGLGANPVTRPHHQQGIVSRFGTPAPGLLSGGPNAIDSGLSSVYPSRAYVDDSESYTVNETAIDMNSALVFVLARFAQPGAAAGTPYSGPTNGR